MRLFVNALAALAALSTGAWAVDLPPDSAVSLERYQEVLTRPLFSPGRRGVATNMAPDQPAELPILQGVVLARDKRIALVAFGNPSTVRRVKEGQDLGQWRIEKILADQVALRSPEGKTAVVRLKSAGADKARQTVNSETNEQQAAPSGPKR